MLNSVLVIKGFFFLLALATAIYVLVLVAKKKRHFQIYPDSIKAEYLKMTRVMTILNIVAVLTLLLSYFMLNTNFFYAFVMFSMFLSAHSLLSYYEDLGEIGK